MNRSFSLTFFSIFIEKVAVLTWLRILFLYALGWIVYLTIQTVIEAVGYIFD